MKPHLTSSIVRPARLWVLPLLVAVGVDLSSPTFAYPPAPFHLFVGVLRDEYGTPIHSVGAEVILETTTGVQVKTIVNPGIEGGANYRLEVPMDAGLMATPYKPTALRPFASFRMKVRVGKVTYLPIEMRGDYGTLGQPGKRTRLNLTLGEDSNGDGLPDAWQRLIDPDLSKVSPDADAGNGLNYLQTYLAGTYTVDPKEGFELSMVGVTNGVSHLEFLAVTGRTYSLVTSTDLKSWTPTTFRMSGATTNGPVKWNYLSDSVRKVRVEATDPSTETVPSFYRLMVE